MTDTARRATIPPAEAKHRSLVPFFVLVSVLAIPFWVAAAMVDVTDRTPIGLPLSALMFVCPVIAAGILTYRHGGRPELVRLLKRAVDYFDERRGWYLFAIVVTPAIALMSYGVAWLMGLVHYSKLPTPLAAVPVVFLAFLLAAAFEELGWAGYATDPLRRRFGVLGAGLILGAFWGAWHLLPLIQAHHGPLWIMGWFVGTLGLRTIVVWLFYKTGKSVLSAMLIHAMANVCAAAIPDYTMTHSVLISGVLTAIVAAAVTLRARSHRRG
ncbi:CPBP family intramembrane glutamic endopeptidase [Nonomuraea fuscirosea]|uniref:CPBP family intramembrane glutamic endopeptidase n=1 Tax=Nonomuraea fuscirosea TaxID=1291556 RepID=UPI00348DA91A